MNGRAAVFLVESALKLEIEKILAMMRSLRPKWLIAMQDLERFQSGLSGEHVINNVLEGFQNVTR